MERTMEGTSLLEVAVLFFQSVTLPQSRVTAEECFVEMAKLVREELGRADPSFLEPLMPWRSGCGCADLKESGLDLIRGLLIPNKWHYTYLGLDPD
ncbi:hypothetical protein EJ110_NYTH36767 [Nymphaea thermarum]|nr:hypothetical protein EJ110_NYTH36767 [Nymphaea thermarum]